MICMSAMSSDWFGDDAFVRHREDLYLIFWRTRNYPTLKSGSTAANTSDGWMERREVRLKIGWMVKERISAKKIGSEDLQNDIASATSSLYIIYNICQGFVAVGWSPPGEEDGWRRFKWHFWSTASRVELSWQRPLAFVLMGRTRPIIWLHADTKYIPRWTWSIIKQPTTNAVFRVERQRLKIQILYHLLTVRKQDIIYLRRLTKSSA